MRFQKMSRSANESKHHCFSCGRIMQTDREIIWCDLDGPAYQAYYCDECKTRQSGSLSNIPNYNEDDENWIRSHPIRKEFSA